jgi:hypothetical protein
VLGRTVPKECVDGREPHVAGGYDIVAPDFEIVQEVELCLAKTHSAESILTFAVRVATLRHARNACYAGPYAGLRAEDAPSADA